MLRWICGHIGRRNNIRIGMNCDTKTNLEQQLQEE